MRGRGALLVALCAGWWAAPAVASADNDTLYQWTDEHGVVRYTPDRGRVPGSARDVQEIVAPPAPATGDGHPEAPAALPAVMGSKLPAEQANPEEAPPSNPKALEARITELREAIARDQAALEKLVAASRKGEASPDDARLQALANRLPVMRSELLRLEELQRQRASEKAGP